ncbi:hypothetical protein KAOT1_15027 [Kordia algicida OT-1]|uniref:Uncharacterized protein n=1 Tax=Kordia algicida OT-1 TaxID=391587 RepID=A9DLD1_9FLAO|nr:hypothetical protein KAOT1_15027 [Kordia algicida OT-1]
MAVCLYHNKIVLQKNRLPRIFSNSRKDESKKIGTFQIIKLTIVEVVF